MRQRIVRDPQHAPGTPGRAEAVGDSAQLALQRLADSSPTVQKLRRGDLPAQLTKWRWNGAKWEMSPEGQTDDGDRPNFKGKQVGQEHGEESGGTAPETDPYAEAETLSNGTIIDYPALVAVMNGVEIGTSVAPSVWRKMRQDLSEAITMKNKSHPAHGSNFNAPQRPEQQIVDWANVLSSEVKEKLNGFFVAQYGLHLV